MKVPALPESQVAYLRGLQEWNLRTASSITNAISQFQLSVAADPKNAPAFAALSRCYAIGPIFGVGKPTETMPKAREFATRAIALDPDLAEAHSVLAIVAAHYDYDWPTAQREFSTALRLNPSDPYAHLFYSNSYLSVHGRHDQAIAEIKQAIALDPLSIPLQAFLIRTYEWARKYDEARAQFERTNEIAPNFALIHERAAHLFASQGDFQRAIEEDARARMLSGELAETVIARRDLALKSVAQGGAPSYWQSQLDASRQPEQPPEAYASPFGLAVIYSRLGLRKEALNELEKAFDERDVYLTEINVEPAFDGLRHDPRFQNLLHRLNLS
jgi:tetratricopeptide (TPR) repeat protein